MPVIVREGDLIEYIGRGYMICHQCNLVSRSVAGLAAYIYKNFPKSNVRGVQEYGQERFGTNDIVKVGGGAVANLYSQIYPGPTDSNGYTHRHNKFWSCLESLPAQCEKLKITKIAFPKNIGCGLAGGDWHDYNKMINDFAEANPHLTVVIVDRGY